VTGVTIAQVFAIPSRADGEWRHGSARASSALCPALGRRNEGGSSSVFRRTTCAAFVLLLAIGILASGCDIQGFRVRLKDFTSTAIEGLWVWQRSPATGKYVRHSQIEFGSIYRSAGNEYLSYTFTTGADVMGLQSLVQRASTSPDTVTLNLAFLAVGSGSYKMSSFNAAGESALSTGTLVR